MAAAAALVLAGFAHAEARSYGSEAAFWRRTCRLNPWSGPASYNLAHSLWKAERDREGARAEFERMRWLAPGFAFGMCGYADFLGNGGDHEGAIAVVEEGLRHRPGNVPLLRKLGQALLAAERSEEALAAFREAEKAGMDGPGFQCDYAAACKRNLLWAEAWRRYLKAAEGDSGYRRLLGRQHLLVANPTPLPAGAKGVAVVGDSVPHGTDGRGADGQERPLSERLSERLDRVRTCDASVPGSWAEELETAWAAGGPEFPFRPRWCVVWTGHNDAFARRSADDILRRIAGCVFQIRTRGMWPLVVGPVPVVDEPGKKRGEQDRILAELDGKLGRFCREARVDYVSARAGLGKMKAPEGGWHAAGSGNHLSDAGMERMADLCAEAIRGAEGRGKAGGRSEGGRKSKEEEGRSCWGKGGGDGRAQFVQ